MMKKRTILATAAFLAGTAGMVASTLPASAATVVGNVVVADNGQGCWTGGALLSDGTETGSGNCSFDNGKIILHVGDKTWSGNATTGVTLCRVTTVVKIPADVLLPTGVIGFGCFGPLPVGQTPSRVDSGDGSSILVKITLR